MSNIITNKCWSYNDLTIVPARISRVNSRSEIDIRKLPIFTAPMSTVTNWENERHWLDNGITPIIPRNVPLEERELNMNFGRWVAFSLSEAKKIFINDYEKNADIKANICIDVANGHMQQLLDVCKQIKLRFGNQVAIMAGNVANPETIINYSAFGIDYVRLSIGSGAGCLTAPQTGVHYPIASLIHDCYEIKKSRSLPIKLVADGGIRNYGDVIKALALGADYVMIGSVFASLFESAAEFTNGATYPDVGTEELKRELISIQKPSKIFYGMSTKRAQKMIKPDGEILKTSEGVEKIIPCTHTVKQWSDNMRAYLRSAMSYCDCFTLEDFIGKQTLIVNSPAELNSVNK